MPEEANTQLALPGLSPGGDPGGRDEARAGQGKLVRAKPNAAPRPRRQHAREEPQILADGDRLADQIADRLGGRLAEPPNPGSGRLIDAAEVARILGCARGWVYEHKAELGVVRLGAGERPRLRFDRERVKVFAAGPAPSPPTAPYKRRRRPRRRAPLLEIKGGGR